MTRHEVAKVTGTCGDNEDSQKRMPFSSRPPHMQGSTDLPLVVADDHAVCWFRPSFRAGSRNGVLFPIDQVSTAITRTVPKKR